MTNFSSGILAVALKISSNNSLLHEKLSYDHQNFCVSQLKHAELKKNMKKFQLLPGKL